MLKRLEVVGFKSFSKKTVLDFSSATTAIVGPNGSGKSNVAEAFRFALGEQSMKSMRGKRAEDLIWGGSHSMPRSNRAGVAIIFDNGPRGGQRPFKMDFDEVAIERSVLRDGTSEYSINGSRVRLRDIQELLAGANIGQTEHHIISQGEADRVMLVNPRERRAMLEDALGLHVYEFKKREAQGKFAKTEENITQINALRRELAPHLRFLARQVEKLERADELRRQLVALAQTYFAIEDAYIVSEKLRATNEQQEANERLAVTSADLARIEDGAAEGGDGVKRLALLREAERSLASLRGKKSELARELGRVEGALGATKERSARAAREPYAKVPREELSALAEEIAREADRADSFESAKAALGAVRGAVKAFVSRFVSSDEGLLADEERAAYALEEKHTALLEGDAALGRELEAAESALQRAREALTAHEEMSREERRRILGLAEEKAAHESAVARCEARERELTQLSEELDRTKAETVALAGRDAISYEPLMQAREEERPARLAEDAESRRAQEERKRQLERLSIRLEEAGGAGEEIRGEHKEASEREAFLARELEDLAKSAAGLKSLIQDLDTELAKHFADGLSKVNASFNEYFALMFGGGSARLVLEEFDDEVEADAASAEDAEEPGDEVERKERQRPGIEIAVSLPKKKVRSLMQLSGGERALTSIALIFAMSQVNPPPFLILDETDAALDEANSRRYGDMIENLARRSQLIVITHNRETMSRAGILYGVTMGGDGVSKLLSVKFEDALAVAK
ncbi:MAG: AAA family ATPase [bacterium]|nr:AAA family ATPase [bacterium]